MTELEFIQSLPQNLTEEQKLEKLNEWRANNPQPEVEEEVEETVEKEMSLDDTSQAIRDAEERLYYQQNPDKSPFAPRQAAYEERDAAIEAQRQEQIAAWKESEPYKEFTKVAEPDKVITENGYDFKYTLNPETGDTQYYYKKAGEEGEWLQHDGASEGNIAVADVFGHVPRLSSADALEYSKGALLSIDSTANYKGEEVPVMSQEELDLLEDFNTATDVTDDQETKINTEVDDFMDSEIIPELRPETDEYGNLDLELEKLIQSGVKVTKEDKINILKTREMVRNPEWDTARDEAIKLVAKANGLGDRVEELDMSDPAIQSQVDQQMRNTKARGLIDKQEEVNIEEWIENQEYTDEENKGRWSNFLKNAAIKSINPALRFATPSNAEVLFDKTNAQKVLADYKRKKKKGLDVKTENIINWYDKANESLGQVQTAINLLANANYATPEQAAEGKAELKRLQDKVKVIRSMQEQKGLDLDNLLLKTTDVSEELNLLERNYNNIPLYAANLKNSALELGLAVEEVVFRALDAPNAFTTAEQRAAFSVVSPTLSFAMNLLSPKYKEKRKELIQIVDEFKDGMMDGVAPPKSIGELNDGDDWGRYFAQLLGSQTINTAILFTTGGMALPILATSATGSTFREIQKEIDGGREAYEAWEKAGGHGEPPHVVDYNPYQMYGVAIGAGVLEGTLERLSFGIINRALKASQADKLVKRGFVDSFKYMLTGPGARATIKGATRYGTDVVSESLEEGAVELGNNLLRRYVLQDSSGSLWDGLPDAMFSGGFMAGGVYKSPMLFSNIASMVQGPDSQQVIAQNRAQILEIQDNILSNPNMSIENKRILENKIGTLVKQSSNEINKTLNRYSVMPREEIDALGDIDMKIFKNKQDIVRIQEDDGIVSGKEKLIEGLQQENENLSGQKNKILEPYVKNDKDISNLSDVELKGREIEAGAQAIAEQLDVGMETFENEADVKGALETLREQGGEVDEKNSTSYGTIVTLEDGSTQILINNEAAKQDRVITTPQHEVLHAVLKQKLANNPELANKLGTDLLNELQNNPDIEVSQEVLDRIDQYKDDPNQAEEIINIVSEALTNSALETPTKGIGTINIKKPGIMKRIGGFFTNLFNKEGVNVKFETGKDVLDFVIKYNKAVEKGEGLTPELMEVAEVQDEVDINQQAKEDLSAIDQRINITQITADQTFEDFRAQQVKDNQVDRSILDENRDQAITAFETIQNNLSTVKESKVIPDTTKTYMELDNSILQQALISEIENNGENQFTLAQAIVEKNWPLISKSLNIESQVEIDAAKEVVIDQLLGQFEGSGQGKYSARNTSLLAGFSLDPAAGVPAAQVSTYLTETVRTRKPEIDAAIQDRVGKQGADLKEAITTTVETTETIDETKLAKKPSETTDLDKVTETKITEATKKWAKNIEGDIGFAETRNIPLEIAQIYGDMFGFNPTTLVDKKRNFQKTDARGLTKAKQFLIKNAQADYQRMVKLKNDMGKGTFVPNNVKNALFTEGEFTATLKDYLNLINEKATKPIYRDRTAQTIKGLLALHIRNRMLETAQPSKAKRVQSGAKFSKRIKAVEVGKIKKSGVTTKTRDQQAFDIQQATKAVKKAWADMSTIEKVSQLKDLSKVLAKYGLGRLLTSTNLTQRADPQAARALQIAITEIGRVKANKNITKQRKAQIEKALEAGELLDLTALRKSLGDIAQWSPAVKQALNADARAPQRTLKGKDSIPSKVNQNLNNLTEIEKGGKEIRKIIRDILKNNPKLLPALDYLLYQVNNNKSFARVMAPLVGYINQKGFNQSNTVGEHALQYGVFTTLFESQALTLNEADFNDFNDWLANNYVQIQLASGKKSSWNGSGVEIQEKTYEANSPDVFNRGEVGIAWKGKNQMHPQIQEVIDKVNKGELSWAEVKINYPDLSLVRYFSKYGYKNANTFMYKGKTAADQFGAKVDSIYTKVDSKGVPFFPNVVKVQAYAINKVLTNQWTNAQAQSYVNLTVPIAVMESNANVTIAEMAGDIIPTAKESKRVPRTTVQVKKVLENSNTAKVNAQKINKKAKGISMFDMDDTLALTKEKVKYTMPDGRKGELTAAEFSQQAETLQEQGVKFDFSAFENVDLSTPKGPLAGVALKRQAKYGSKDIYVVTARPGASQQSIKLFLDSIGLNIPLGNIVTLEDGTPQAKADFVLQKAAEGYNDFYFADDSALNVNTVKKILDQIDVKSKTQIAIANKAKRLDVEFNDQIEDVTGKEAFKEYSDSRARLEGKKKDGGIVNRLGKQLTITYSAEDFMGLMYGIIGKGKKGDKQARWIKENIMDPYNNAEQAVLSAQVTVANDFAALKKQFPTLKSKMGNNPLMSQIGVGPYTKSQGIRVYLWDKQGIEIPGMSKRDQAALVKAVKADIELQTFADEVALIQKTKKYPAPSSTWLAGDITTDVLKGIDTTFRTEQMTEFNENVDVIFSNKNLNKLEAIYGSKYREALEDSLRRMKSGSNRPIYTGGGSRIVNEMLDWLNSSVGVVMFLNMRSGLLQLISNVNFVNWGDNNMYAAAKAFASKDYFPTVMKLMNSDYLVNRRDGLKINVNEAELADAGRKGGFKGMLNYLLDKGFIITRIMDSLAIATGGATFYINRLKAIKTRINPETGKLYTETEAETKAFKDFYEIAEETQQSSNPSRISQQQASLAGRVILSFQNVTMQYTRKTKKSIKDLYNRRKKPGMTQRESDLSNISSIIYYTTVQNLIFHSLQQALFALAFDDDEDEKSKNKAANIANGMVDSLLFGLGFGGAAISTVKNVLMKLATEKEKKSPAYQDVVWDVFDISPVIDSKIRKLRSAAKTFSWNMEEIKERGWSIDNPAYLAVAQIISAVFNAPLDRVLRKTMNLRQAMDEETRVWQKVALVLGWDGWGLGLPYWGLPSTIKKEAEDQLRIEKQYKNDVRKLKRDGYEKAKSKKYVTGKLNVNYIQVESPTGIIEYWRVPKNKKK